jgi:ABC-type proline/glycine betaine transport system permease subunit
MSTLDLARHEQINVLDDIVELVSPNVWVTGGVVLLAPFILPVIIKGLRPVVKGTIKGYLTIQDKVKEYAAVTSEQMSDLIAEVRAEHAAAGTIAAVESVMVEAPSVEVKKSPSRESSKKSE